MTDYTRAVDVEIAVAHGASGMPYLSFSLQLAEPGDCPEEEAVRHRMVDGEAHIDLSEDDEGIEIDINYVWEIVGDGESLTTLYDSLAPQKQQVPLTSLELEAVYDAIESRVDDFAWELQRAWDRAADENRAADKYYGDRDGY